MQVFDRLVAAEMEANVDEDEILIYNLLCCFYLCLKADNRLPPGKGYEQLLSFKSFVT